MSKQKIAEFVIMLTAKTTKISFFWYVEVKNSGYCTFGKYCNKIFNCHYCVESSKKYQQTIFSIFSKRGVIVIHACSIPVYYIFILIGCKIYLCFGFPFFVYNFIVVQCDNI